MLKGEVTALEASFVLLLCNLHRITPDFFLRNCTIDVKIIRPNNVIFDALAFKSRNPTIKGQGVGWGWMDVSTLPLLYNIFSLLFSYYHLSN